MKQLRTAATHRGLLLLATVLISSTQAQSQNFFLKKELFGKFGYGNTAEDEGTLGSGAVFGGGVGFQISQRWQLAAEFHYQENTLFRGAGKFFSEGHSVAIGGSALYHFSDSHVQPYLRFGLSFARFDGAKGFAPQDEGYLDQPADPGWRREGKQDFLGPEFGAGMKIFVTKNISLRPELRLYAGGSGGYDPYKDPVEPGLFFSSAMMAVGYHW